MKISQSAIQPSDISRNYQTGNPPDVRTRPYVSIVRNDSTQTGNVASGGSEAVVITAPAGYIYRVIGLYIRVSADVDATSGTHKVNVASAQHIDLTTGESTYNSPISYNLSTWVSADVSQNPSDGGAQQQFPLSLVADETNGIRLTYTNNTDVAQENDRIYKLVLKKIKV